MMEFSFVKKIKVPSIFVDIIHKIVSLISQYKKFPLLQESTGIKSKIIIPRGLRNLGNTCFLNSILQALSSFQQLQHFLAFPQTTAKSRTFSSKLLNCLQGIRPHERSAFSYSPSDLFNDLVKFNQSFRGYQQQDAQELFQTISTIVTNEKNQVFRKSQLSISNIFKAGNANINAQLENVSSVSVASGNLRHAYQAIYTRDEAVNPFQGLLASRMKCTKCNHERTSLHEAFTCLSLPIRSTSKSLFDCFENFTVGEPIEGVECGLCSVQASIREVKRTMASTADKIEKDKQRRILDAISNCYVHGTSDTYLKDLDSLESPVSSSQSLPSTDHESLSELSDNSLDSFCQISIHDSVQKVRSEVIRSTRISRYPNLLCLHLQRLEFDMLTGNMKKIQQHVKYPLSLKGRDLMSFYHTATQSTPGIHLPDWYYSLKAVVVHMGTANAGHYVTYSLVQEKPQSDGQWILFSDDQVQHATIDQVLSAQAYMLFYEINSLT